MTAGGECLAEIDAVILAGGLGTRTKAILGNTPKLLAPVAGRPLFDHLIEWLQHFGARRVVLCLGHLADAVRTHVGHHAPAGLDIVQVVEDSPQGTAGAVRMALAHTRSRTILVLNGDTLVDADLCAFLASHRASGADASLLCAAVSDAGRYGRVATDGAGRIVAFAEKVAGARPGLVSAGVYLLDQQIMDEIQRIPGPSLERDVFAALPSGTLHACVEAGAFLDIGTPNGLAAAADRRASSPLAAGPAEQRKAHHR